MNKKILVLSILVILIFALVPIALADVISVNAVGFVQPGDLTPPANPGTQKTALPPPTSSATAETPMTLSLSINSVIPETQNLGFAFYVNGVKADMYELDGTIGPDQLPMGPGTVIRNIFFPNGISPDDTFELEIRNYGSVGVDYDVTLGLNYGTQNSINVFHMPYADGTISAGQTYTWTAQITGDGFIANDIDFFWMVKSFAPGTTGTLTVTDASGTTATTAVTFGGIGAYKYLPEGTLNLAKGDIVTVGLTVNAGSATLAPYAFLNMAHLAEATTTGIGVVVPGGQVGSPSNLIPFDWRLPEFDFMPGRVVMDCPATVSHDCNWALIAQDNLGHSAICDGIPVPAGATNYEAFTGPCWGSVAGSAGEMVSISFRNDEDQNVYVHEAGIKLQEAGTTLWSLSTAPQACDQTISTPGTVTLSSDVVTVNDYAYCIDADNVILDCAGHKITGGVVSVQPGHTGIEVQNCDVDPPDDPEDCPYGEYELPVDCSVTLRNNSADGKSMCTGVYATGATVNIIDSTFASFETGIIASDSVVSITGSTFTNNGQDMSFSDAEVDIENSTIVGPGDKPRLGLDNDEIIIVPPKTCSIKRTDFNGAGVGTAVLATNANVLIEDVTVNNFETGITEIDSALTVTGSSFTDVTIGFDIIHVNEGKGGHQFNAVQFAGNGVGTAVSVTNADILMEDVTITNFNDGVVLTNVPTAAITGITLSDIFMAGVSVDNVGVTTINGITVNTAGIGVSADEVNTLSITGGDFDNVDVAVDVDYGVVTVSSTDINTADIGVRAIAPDAASILNLNGVTMTNVGVGIDAVKGVVNVNPATISAITTGINLAGVAGATITGSAISDAETGVYVDADSSNVRLESNVFNGNAVDINNQDAATGNANTCDESKLVNYHDDGQVNSCDTSSTARYADIMHLDLHIVDQAKVNACPGGKGSCKIPIEGVLFKVFDRTVLGYTPTRDSFGAVYEGSVGMVSSCTTNANGDCTAYESAAGSYVVIGKYTDQYGTVYVGSSKDPSDFVLQPDGTYAVTKNLQVLKKIASTGTKTKPATKITLEGSHLEIIFPDPWLANNYYEVIADAAPDGGVWTDVQVTLEPPVGFQADPNPVVLGTVANDVAWSQSYITEVGSDPSDPFVLRINADEKAIVNPITGAAVAGKNQKKELYVVVEGNGKNARDKALNKASQLHAQGRQVHLGGKKFNGK